MRIAVIGSGVAGLTCAHVLGPHHDVVLYEADSRLGGHANTVTVDDPVAGELGVDTGFIVHNDRNYPNLCRLFAELAVPTQDGEMSFAVTDRASGFSYRATDLDSLLASRSNVMRPALWRMVADIFRFHRAGRRFLADPDPEMTIGGFLDRGRYSRAFIDLHLIPMGAAVWSADPTTFDRFPAASLLGFLDNHGLLSIGNRPQWRTVTGGSRVYVSALAERFHGEVRTAAPVQSVRREADGVVVTVAAGTDRFDRVVLAAHSDQSLGMLADATVAEKEILGAIAYRPNRAVLHTDIRQLSPHRRAWASWNYERPPEPTRDPVVTYDLTTLQRLGGANRYLVTLNAEERIDPGRILARFDYAHPVFDRPAIAAQQRHDEIDGADRVHFAGAYWANGFHEDGVASALAVCERIGVRW